MKKISVIPNHNFNPSLHQKKNYSSQFFTPIAQPKLTINNPNDEHEQEADTISDKVMRMEPPFIRPKQLRVSSVQRKCEPCEEEEKKMQRKEINDRDTTADNKLENYVGNLNMGGQSLSNEVRNFYEPRFGYDFSEVRIHNNSQAHQSAEALNALAYTQGNHIVFNRGQYQPATEGGKKLLAHELTHTLQQNGSRQNIQRLVRKDLVANCEGQSSKPTSDLKAAEQIAFDLLRKGIKKIELAEEQYREAVHQHLVPSEKDLEKFPEALKVGKLLNSAFGFPVGKSETWDKLRIIRIRFMHTLSYLDSVVFDYNCCDNDSACPKIGKQECKEGLSAIVIAEDDPNLIILCPEFWGSPISQALTITHEIMHLWSRGFIKDRTSDVFGIEKETPKFQVASRYEKFLKLLNS